MYWVKLILIESV